MKKTIKFEALLLALCMMLSLCNFPAFAEESKENKTTEELIEVEILDDVKSKEGDPSEASVQIVTEAPSEPVVKETSQPAAEAPAQSVVEAPAESIAETPAQSVVEPPAQSAVEAPAQSVVEVPVQEPVVETTVQEPVVETTVQPNIVEPIQPVVEAQSVQVTVVDSQRVQGHVTVETVQSAILSQSAADAPAQPVVEAPNQQPAVEENIETVTEESIKVIAEEPVEVSAEEPVEVSAEEPVEVSAEEPLKDSVEEPLKDSVEESVDDSAEEPVEDSSKKPVENTAEEPVEDSSKKPVEDTAEESMKDSVEESVESTAEEPHTVESDENSNFRTKETVRVIPKFSLSYNKHEISAVEEVEEQNIENQTIETPEETAATEKTDFKTGTIAVDSRTFLKSIGNSSVAAGETDDEETATETSLETETNNENEVTETEGTVLALTAVSPSTGKSEDETTEEAEKKIEETTQNADEKGTSAKANGTETGAASEDSQEKKSEDETKEIEEKNNEGPEDEEGNLTAKEEGLILDGDGEFDVLISGTLASEGTPVLISESVNPANVSITVWKIENPVEAENASGEKEKHVVLEGEQGKDDQKVTDNSKAVEQKIQYIIKVEPSQEEMFNLSGVEKSHGYDVANEDETVTIKINVPAGATVKAAYGTEGKELPLEKDNDGNYFVKVPRGGGVFLHAEIEEAEKKKTEPKADDTSVTDWSGFNFTYSYEAPVEQPVVNYEQDQTIYIFFDLNGGILNGQTGTIRMKGEYGKLFSLLEAPTREGYRFVCWQPDIEEITARMPGDTFEVRFTVTFTAIWEYIGGYQEEARGAGEIGIDFDYEEDDEEDDDDDDEKTDVTETIRYTDLKGGENEEKKISGSVIVEDKNELAISVDIATGTGAMGASKVEIEVGGEIRVTGGDQGATGVKATADGPITLNVEVEPEEGMHVNSTDGGLSVGIDATAKNGGTLSLEVENNVESGGVGAKLTADGTDSKVTLIIGDENVDSAQ